MQPYQGLVALDQTNLARCLEDYFEHSEQLDTRLFFAGGAEYESDVGVTLLLALPNHAGITIPNAMPPKMLGKHLPHWLQQ